MSSNEDRKQRDLDLLMKSYKALEAEQNNPEPEPDPRPEAANPRRRGSDSNEPTTAPEAEVPAFMYRGRPVRGGSGATPGAGSSQGQPRQFRGATGEKKNPPTTSQLEAALKKLAVLRKEGLITKAEYDQKRLQILDRL